MFSLTGAGAWLQTKDATHTTGISFAGNVMFQIYMFKKVNVGNPDPIDEDDGNYSSNNDNDSRGGGY